VTDPLAKAFFIWIVKFLKSTCDNSALALIPKKFKIGEICAVFASSNPRETGKYEYHTDDAIVNLNFCIEMKGVVVSHHLRLLIVLTCFLDRDFIA
jgi:hypothetical protein